MSRPGGLVAGQRLSEQQEAFCIAYVTNGGHAAEAAASAGYAFPETAGPRQLQKLFIGERIRQLTALNLTSRLGELTEALLQIALDPLTPPRERVQALNSLLDRAGLAVPKGGPSVAVQVNVGGADGQTAQALIREIWANKEARKKALDMATDSGGHAAPALIDAKPLEE